MPAACKAATADSLTETAPAPGSCSSNFSAPLCAVPRWPQSAPRNHATTPGDRRVDGIAVLDRLACVLKSSSLTKVGCSYRAMRVSPLPALQSRSPPVSLRMLLGSPQSRLLHAGAVRMSTSTPSCQNLEQGCNLNRRPKTSCSRFFDIDVFLTRCHGPVYARENADSLFFFAVTFHTAVAW